MKQFKNSVDIGEKEIVEREIRKTLIHLTCSIATQDFTLARKQLKKMDNLIELRVDL